MKVRVKLFAVAKELAGRDELAIDLPAGATYVASGAPSWPTSAGSRELCRTHCGLAGRIRNTTRGP